MSESGPKLVLVESFDELRVGHAVWAQQNCCGKLGGRYVIIRFRPSVQAVYPDLRIKECQAFEFAPKHECKVAFYKVGLLKKFPICGSLITSEEVEARQVYVEVVDLRERDDVETKIPLALPARAM